MHVRASLLNPRDMLFRRSLPAAMSGHKRTRSRQARKIKSRAGVMRLLPMSCAKRKIIVQNTTHRVRLAVAVVGVAASARTSRSADLRARFSLVLGRSRSRMRRCGWFNLSTLVRQKSSFQRPHHVAKTRIVEVNPYAPTTRQVPLFDPIDQVVEPSTRCSPTVAERFVHHRWRGEGCTEPSFQPPLGVGNAFRSSCLARTLRIQRLSKRRRVHRSVDPCRLGVKVGFQDWGFEGFRPLGSLVRSANCRNATRHGHKLPEKNGLCTLARYMARIDNELTVDEMAMFEQRLGTALLSPSQRESIRAALKIHPVWKSVWRTFPVKQGVSHWRCCHDGGSGRHRG